jgi:hypothetical protein
VPHIEGRHAGVGSGVPSSEEVGVDGVGLEGLVLGIGRGTEAERVLEIGREVRSRGRVGGQVRVRESILPGGPIRVGGVAEEEEGFVGQLGIEPSGVGGALRRVVGGGEGSSASVGGSRWLSRRADLCTRVRDAILPSTQAGRAALVEWDCLVGEHLSL